MSYYCRSCRVQFDGLAPFTYAIIKQERFISMELWPYLFPRHRIARSRLSERGSEAAFCELRVVVKLRAFHAAGDFRSRVGRGAFGGIISLSSLTRNANAEIRGNKHGLRKRKDCSSVLE